MDQFLAKLASEIINPLILLLFALGIMYFLWGVLQFIQNAGDPGKREQGKMHIIWSLVGLFIMVSVYGILQILMNTLI